MKFSTILASMILKRQKSACARCAGDGVKVTRGSRQIENFGGKCDESLAVNSLYSLKLF